MLYINTIIIPTIYKTHQTYTRYIPGHKYQVLFPSGHSHTSGSMESCDVPPHNGHMFSPSRSACT